MRQKDDLKFVEALNAIAMGNMTAGHKNLFEKRIASDESVVPSNAIFLFYRNENVNAFNMKNINDITSNKNMKYIAAANDEISHTAKDIRKNFDEKKAIQSFKNLPYNKANGLPNELIIKKDIRYMMTRNLNVADGLCNGSTVEFVH